MKSKSWKKLFLPEIKTRSEKNIILIGEKTIVRRKTREDLKNDYGWRIDPELSDLDATVPINLTYEQFQRISINEIEKPSPWSLKFSIRLIQVSTLLGIFSGYALAQIIKIKINKKAKPKIETKCLNEYPPINESKTTDMKINAAVEKFDGIINEIIKKG